MHQLAQGLRRVKFTWNQVSSNLLLILYSEGKKNLTLVVCFLLPLKREIKTILYSFIPFSSCPQNFLASGSFPMSQFFASGGQSIGVLTLASVLPIFRLMLSKELSRVFSGTKIQKHQSFGS